MPITSNSMSFLGEGFVIKHFPVFDSSKGIVCKGTKILKLIWKSMWVCSPEKEIPLKVWIYEICCLDVFISVDSKFARNGNEVFKKW